MTQTRGSAQTGALARGRTGGARTLRWGALVAALAVVAAVTTTQAVAGGYGGTLAGGRPRCGPSTAPANEPSGGHTMPPAAPAYFAADFPVLPDDQWHYRLGGFGGLHRGARLHHTPVIFVHGNQGDAQNWLDVMLQFATLEHYSMQEMYALSYNGLGNYYAGSPDRNPPTTLDEDYLRQNPSALANGGHGAADDDKVPDLCRFVEAVQAYTGSAQVDIVTHSLGVTLARKFMADYPSLARDVTAFVGIAGANHGTTVCRGLDTSYYGCNEIAPGTAWLAALNGPGGAREGLPPTHWLTVYDGLAVGDPFFTGPDAGSPALRNAQQLTFPGANHNDLRADSAEVDGYLAFLLTYGQAGPGADRSGPAEAARLRAGSPNGETGSLCGIPALTGPQPGC
ncbi:MAG TPA: hypothetical protein VNE21_08360 [Mycobacteriales bacterium]|nr:hypothetical protein [Mycobacteriales bacterium]